MRSVEYGGTELFRFVYGVRGVLDGEVNQPMRGDGVGKHGRHVKSASDRLAVNLKHGVCTAGKLAVLDAPAEHLPVEVSRGPHIAGVELISAERSGIVHQLSAS